jgi:outer membrane protein assembly factor BamB
MIAKGTQVSEYHPMKIRITLALLLCLVVPSRSPAATGNANWPQFRGWNASGVSADANVPDRWSATDNVAWKTDLSGRSWSSPIVWGNRVFLTTVVNLGASEPPKKGLYLGGERPESPKSEHLWKVLCLDLVTGRVQWEQTVHRGAPQTSVHLKNTYGAETPVTDGERVYNRERLPEGLAFTSSPWATGERIFCLNEDGICYVLRAGDKFELLHINKLAGDDMCMATPALAGDRLLIRTAVRLYCFRAREPAGH